MKKLFFLLITMCVFSLPTMATDQGADDVKANDNGKMVYMFTGHREPALDGLHLMYSYDGYHWIDTVAEDW